MTTWYTNRLHRPDFNKFWEAFEDCFPAATAYLSPNEKTFPISLNLAGYKSEDIDIAVDDGILSVVAENETMGKKSLKAYIPEETDVDTITASLELGVLTIEGEKYEKEKPRKIPIN